MSSLLSNVRLRSKLLASFGLILTILIVLSAAASLTTAANQRAADLVTHSLQVISTTNALLADLVDMETGYRGFLLTGDEAFLQPYLEGSRSLDERLAQLRQLTAANARQLARWQMIEADLADWQAVAAEPGIALRREVTAGRASLDDVIAWVGTGEGRRRFNSMRRVIGEALADEEASLAERQAAAADARARLQIILVVGTVGAVGLSLLLATVLTADLVGPVGRLAASARRIADGNLRQRVGLRRRDEIGAAAEAFDQMAERLQEIVVRNETILRTAAEGIVGLDGTGRITFANPAAAAILGARSAELAGQELVPRLTPGGDDADDGGSTDGANGQATPTVASDLDHLHPIVRTLTHGTVERGSADLLGPDDGARLPIEYVCAPIRESGTVVGAVLTFRDITERRAAQRALEDRARELARSNADLEQFAYVSSHDLQEPLRAVVSYLQLLERRYRGQLDERADRYIGHAVDGARRMQTLINDLLTYSRVGRRGQEPVPVDLDELLGRVLASLRVAIEESGATVTHEPLPTIVADASQLGQLFQNLIGNAIKFRGEEPPRVHVSVERQDGAWLFSVRDNGIGIAPEYQERVFVLFQRLHARDEYAGTGIGLAVCKKIVERHGGRLWVESTPGKGSTFWFTIPDPDDGGTHP